MPFVADASVIAAWALDEDDPIAAQASTQLQTDTAMVPSLLWWELRNVLVIAERHGRITEERATEFLSQLSQLAIIVDQSPDEATVLRLARRHRLTVYDAGYLELAQRQAL
ncbi:MAG TPA: type II toxin-antitoxin system VapC family toxin, partial [Stellaceae bacterium]|nr:type II toxin-antitoxin system VapC family toxin [Stellaceae bacterium]